MDANHVVGIGEEGFDVTRYRASYGTYTNEWALNGGQGESFTDNIAVADIDFAGIHSYPHLWGMSDGVNDGNHWISEHATVAAAVGKPLIIGEYGYDHDGRAVYEDWLATAYADDTVGGMILWEIITPSRSGTEPCDVRWPTETDLIDILRQHAVQMNAE